MTHASQNSIQKELTIWKKIAQLSAIRPKRGFFIYPQDVEKVVKLIGKNDGDIGLNADFPNALENLISTMEENRGKIMFFIFVAEDSYPRIRKALVGRKFKENEDFFNVRVLNSVYTEGYSHVLNM